MHFWVRRLCHFFRSSGRIYPRYIQISRAPNQLSISPVGLEGHRSITRGGGGWSLEVGQIIYRAYHFLSAYPVFTLCLMQNIYFGLCVDINIYFTLLENTGTSTVRAHPENTIH